MRALRQILGSLLLVFISASTVLGGILLGYTESGRSLATPTVVADIASPAAMDPSPPTVTQLPSALLAQPLAATATSELAAPPTALSVPTPCGPPADWIAVTVQPAETLFGLAARAGSNVQAVAQANCLSNTSVFAGQVVYLPATPPTAPPAPVCGPPAGWEFYTVQPGDNLFRLSLKYSTTIVALQQANCLAGIGISAGQRLYVPPAAIVTNTAVPPTAILPPSATASPPPSATSVPLTPTPTATPTLAPSATNTTAATAVASATPTASHTATTSNTPEVSATPTASPTTPPDTATPTATATPP